MLGLAIGAVWLSFFTLMIVRGYRFLDRWWEFKRWGSKPSYEYFGDWLPAYFPIDLLADSVLFVHVQNGVCWTASGRRHLAFDLQLPCWSRSRKWMTVIAVEGRIVADRPWAHGEEATALQGSGWVVLTPRRPALDNKIWIWRVIDNLPTSDRLLEPDVIFDLWRNVDAIAEPIRMRGSVGDLHPTRRG